MPIHHAVMSRSCPRNAIETLYRDMPACLTAETENGSLPIHLACQYSSDRSMIALLLNYNRYNLNYNLKIINLILDIFVNGIISSNFWKIF